MSLARTPGNPTSPMVVFRSTSRRPCEYCSAPEVWEAALTALVAVEVVVGLLVSGVARRAVWPARSAMSQGLQVGLGN